MVASSGVKLTGGRKYPSMMEYPTPDSSDDGNASFTESLYISINRALAGFEMLGKIFRAGGAPRLEFE